MSLTPGPQIKVPQLASMLSWGSRSGASSPTHHRFATQSASAADGIDVLRDRQVCVPHQYTYDSQPICFRRCEVSCFKLDHCSSPVTRIWRQVSRIFDRSTLERHQFYDMLLNITRITRPRPFMHIALAC